MSFFSSMKKFFIAFAVNVSRKFKTSRQNREREKIRNKKSTITQNAISTFTKTQEDCNVEIRNSTR